MIINFAPQRRDDALGVVVAGDLLTVNGTEFDFSQLPEGATLPPDAIGSEFFAGPVERIDGELHLTLLLPHGPNPTPDQAFPQSIHVTADGPVELPQDVAEEVPA